ncbi:MAG TPA: aminotransferase class I/II-fold pyridoxal phosphate-dependent enzyme, partial [Cyclobacteriaceae bacterium]
MSNSLSNRGLTASKSPLRVDFEAYFEAVKNLYHENENPNGTFPLNVAENKLTWPMLRTKMEELSDQPQIPDWVASYTNSTGSPSFREVVAKFYSRFISKCDINPDHLGMSAGATSIIDLTSWILGEPGDVVVIPAPCYPVYKQDMQNKSGLERYDLVTHHEIEEIANGPLLTIGHLDKALKDIESKEQRFRILVITTP